MSRRTDEPDALERAHPEPRLARFLLVTLLPASDREFVAGDLAEELGRRAGHVGGRAARRWYWKHVMLTILSSWGRALARRREAWRRDLRHALRALRRSPGYSATIGSTLAVGLGAAAAIGTLVESALRPLPLPESDRLVAVWETRGARRRSVAPANYLDWRREGRAFSGLAAHESRGASVTVEGVAWRSRVAVVSGNFFEVLGVEAVLGRTFDPSFDPTFPERLLVLSYAAWRDAFGASPEAIGRSVEIDAIPYRVIGVAPPALRLPESGLFAWVRSTTEAPELAGAREDVTTMRDAWYFQVVGRLAPGLTLRDARGEMGRIAARLARAYPETNEGSGVELTPLHEELVAGVRPTLSGLAIAVILLLLAATLNVTHLALARAEARTTEASIRRALGASKADVSRVTMAEGWILAVAGGIVGVAASAWILARVPTTLTSLPHADEVAMRWPVASCTLGLALAIGTVIARVAVGGAGSSSSRPRVARGSDPRRGALERSLIAVQVATAIALLAGTATMARSLVALASVELGFREQGLTTVRVALPDARMLPYPERAATFTTVRDDLAALPGVSSVGLSSSSPLEVGPRAGVHVIGTPERRDPPSAGWQPVGEQYFRAVGMRLVRGRTFGPEDVASSRDVAVVNEAFARRILGDRDALATSVTMGLDGHDRPLAIVGVVADTRTSGPAREAEPVLYRPMTQTDRYGAEAMLVAVRSAGDRPVPIADVRAALRAEQPGLPVYAESLGTDLARPFRSGQRTVLIVLLVFAVAAVSLAVIGVYGVTAYAVRCRRREIAVRLALGADGARVTSEVLGGGLRTALVGVPIGVALALLLGRVLRGLVFGVTAGDAATLGTVSIAVVATVGAALWAPGRSAARTDPSETLRGA